MVDIGILIICSLASFMAGFFIAALISVASKGGDKNDHR